jgi:hypothetical protein
MRIDRRVNDFDLVVDRGKIRKRKKKASKQYRDAYGHTASRSKKTFFGAAADWL